jgi:hypothetical protein
MYQNKIAGSHSIAAPRTYPKKNNETSAFSLSIPAYRISVTEI